MSYRAILEVECMRFYTIKELEEIVGRTSATLYAYIRSNEETKEFFANHRQERAKGGYLYDSEALQRLKIKFGVEDGVGQEDFEIEDGEITKHSPVPTNDDEESKKSAELEALSAELEDLKGKYEALQADFARVDGERVDLLRQNGNLLLLLSQEKAEKQALLPPPRKTIGERIRSIFKRSPAD